MHQVFAKQEEKKEIEKRIPLSVIFCVGVTSTSIAVVGETEVVKRTNSVTYHGQYN